MISYFQTWFKTNKLTIFIGAVLIIFIIYLFVFSDEQTEVIDQNEELVGNENHLIPEVSEQQVEVSNNSNNIIIVDVKGAVKNPGVYEATSEERVNDIILKAGGLLDSADQKAVNLALKVKDEMVIYVPAKGEVKSEELITILPSKESNPEGKININTADETELQTLTGIGSSKATAIIEYRETNGSFKSIEDLKSVSGIGDKTFEKLKDYIDVK